VNVCEFELLVVGEKEMICLLTNTKTIISSIEFILYFGAF